LREERKAPAPKRAPELTEVKGAPGGPTELQEEKTYAIYNNRNDPLYIRIRLGSGPGTKLFVATDQDYRVSANREITFLPPRCCLKLPIAPLKASDFPITIRAWPATYVPTEDIDFIDEKSEETSERNRAHALYKGTQIKHDELSRKFGIVFDESPEHHQNLTVSAPGHEKNLDAFKRIEGTVVRCSYEGLAIPVKVEVPTSTEILDKMVASKRYANRDTAREAFLKTLEDGEVRGEGFKAKLARIRKAKSLGITKEEYAVLQKLFE